VDLDCAVRLQQQKEGAVGVIRSYKKIVSNNSWAVRFYHPTDWNRGDKRCRLELVVVSVERRDFGLWNR